MVVNVLQTPNISYVNVHAVLDARRNRAKTLSSDDPDSPHAQVNSGSRKCTFWMNWCNVFAV